MGILTNNILISEVVPKAVYNEWGDNAKWFIDIRVVQVAQTISDNINPGSHEPVIINGVFNGVIFDESGLRNPLTETGASMSQHKFGRALDLKFKNYSPDQVRSWIRAHWNELKELGLTTIEKDTPTWTHIDTRYTGLDFLFEV
jgi:hypothetical protein